MGKRNSIKDGKWHLIQLCDDDYAKLNWFHCKKDDINEFFLNDAFEYKSQLLAETYIFLLDKIYPTALVSFINDEIELTHEKQQEYLPEEKIKYKYLPAVKIARLGVCGDIERRGIGSSLLNLCKNMFVRDNRTGCRFMTVDAFRDEKVLNFYRKNGFIFLSSRDRKSDTRVMYCDLLPYCGKKLHASSSPQSSGSS